ncbi:MAG: signal peptidase II [Prevotellaceae bacterium]|jgi:hypothetical protein|nr:signal peptidase II [Prevotellaceae bacterium]
MSIKKVLAWILLLVFIDQIVKIVINSYLLESRFVIVPPLFEFRPVFNGKGPYLLSHLLNLNINLNIILIVYFVVLCLIIILYNKVRKAKNNTILLDFTFIFSAAAYGCAIVGYIFWEKGCLDFIYLKPLFVFDIKDLYSNCFFCLFIIFLYKQRIRTTKDFVELIKLHDKKERITLK